MDFCFLLTVQLHFINHKWSYTVHFDSQELIQKAIRHIDEKLFLS